MKLNAFPPALIFTVGQMSEGFAGLTNGPFVRIHESHSEDSGLIAHELEHVRQFWICAAIGLALLGAMAQATSADVWLYWPMVFAIHGALYKLVPAYRLAAKLLRTECSFDIRKTSLAMKDCSGDSSPRSTASISLNKMLSKH